MVKTVHIIAHGKVHAVGFRFSAQAKANELGLSGFVRNLPDNTVEIQAKGDPKSLEQFINWCRQGPKFAQVKKLAVKHTQPEATLPHSFEII